MYTHTHSLMHACMHTHTQMPTQTKTCTHTCTHTYTHTHTHSQMHPHRQKHTHHTYSSIRAHHESEGFVEPSIVPTPMKHCMSIAIQGSVVILKAKQSPVKVCVHIHTQKSGKKHPHEICFLHTDFNHGPFCLRTSSHWKQRHQSLKPRRK